MAERKQSQAIKVPETIGPHRIKKVLGTGGMGTVFLAEQVSMGRNVALKVLKPQRLQTPGAIDKFIKEARVTASLNHPNLIQVHDAGQDEATGHVYYTMSYVEGPTLTQLLRNQGIPPTEAILRMMYEVAIGLGHAHAKGLVHRDLKPDNIIITTDGHARVTDLGLAFDRMSGQQFQSNRVLSVVGTTEYSAPEQHRNPNWAEPASDVFALGCCLFYACTGQDPFDGETLIDLIVTMATEEPDYGDDFPPVCRTLCDIMMAKEPEDRPQDGTEAAVLIKQAWEGTLPISQPGARRPPGRRPRRRRRR